MPFLSKKQMNWMYLAEKRGELPKGTFDRWKKETKDISKLPEKVKGVLKLPNIIKHGG